MNSPIELTESVTLVNKLIDRTKERRLTWQAEAAAESDKAYRFSANLDPSLKAVIGYGENQTLDFCLIEQDPRKNKFNPLHNYDPPLAADRTVIEVSIEKDPPYGYDTQEESDLSKLLVNLYELARRSAFQIDVSVSKALTYLDKLAV